jgi:sugar O-acyltransferase (sialic acid O-acetyltransferase NeuD family)
MEHPVHMPQLGVNDTEVRLVRWLVEPGTLVHPGTELAEVETSKASLALVAEADGHFYPATEDGTSVTVQDVVAYLLDTPDPERAAALVAAVPAPETQPAGGPRLTARAAELVREHGIDPASLPADRIVREADVLEIVGAAGRTDPLRRVAIYGASPGGTAVLAALLAMGGYEVAGFLDDTPDLAGRQFESLPVWAGDDLRGLADRGIGAVATHIAVRPFRLDLRDRARAAGVRLINVIHPWTSVSPTVRMGVGNLIKAGALLDTHVRLGDCVIVDHGVIVPHHCVLGDACHLAPGVSMGGGCTIGSRTLVGVGATIAPGVRVGPDAIIAPGAVVVRDVEPGSVVSGSPAVVTGHTR